MIHTRANGILLVTLSGSIVAIPPRMEPAIRTVAVQPYQYIAGPSPLRDASHPKTIRFVAGWKVKSGKFQNRQTRYSNGHTMANVTTKVLNLAEVASDDVDGLAPTAVGLVVVVVMTRTPACC
jgi:hypothetical protein